MVTESGLWTVLPHGVDERSGRLRVSLHLAPRLTSDGGGGARLGDFPTYADWAAAVERLPVLLDFEGIGTVDAVPAFDAVRPDPALWHLLFGADVGVLDHEVRDLSERQVNGFPAHEVARDLLGVYADVGAASPTGLPPVTAGPLADFASEIGWMGSGGPDLDGMLGRGFGQESSSLVDGRRGRYLPRQERQAMGRIGTFGTTQRFYDRRLAGEPIRTAEGVVAGPKPVRPRLDFHRYVAALADYPVLLRRLGLVVDLELDDPGLRDRGRVRVVFPEPPADWFAEEQVRPWTNWLYDGPWFLPAPRESNRVFSRGQLHFHREAVWVHQVDIDGSVLKALNAATSLVTQRGVVEAAKGPSMTPDEGSLPALRGAGLTVVRDERVESAVTAFDRTVLAQREVEQGRPADLWAEDVVRGYRVDVDRDGRGFASLCRRVGRYVLQRPGHPDGDEVEIPVDPDEGFVKGASTTAVPGDDELYLHDALLSWSGWSLVAGRPGRRITPEEQLPDHPKPLEHDDEVPLVTSFVPEPGSLAPLRYGAAYRVRVRLTDLAGNSVSGKALDTDDEPSDPETYLRWEPVPAPVVLPRRAFGEGESQLRMVVRSTLGMTPEQYAALPRVAGLPRPGDAGPYLALDDRWVAPPKTSQQMAELHGCFDAALGGSPAEVEAAYAVAARESGELPDLVPEAQLTTPYLPDVSSRGAALGVLPGDGPAGTWTQTWPREAGGEWWDRQPFRLELVAGPAAAPVTPEGAEVAPEWDDAARVLRVSLPQSELVRVRVASALDDRDLDISGPWSLLAPRLPAAMRAQALRGRLWMVSPSLELTVVHAVEKPLAPPVVDVPQSGMTRREGDTWCALTGVIDNHAHSTGRLDVEAQWTEQVDDVAMPAPLDGVDGRALREGQDHVGGFELGPEESDCRVGRTTVTGNGLPTRHELRHELGDTRHRRVDYRARATTRFREYFAPEVAATLGDDGVPLMEHHGPTTTLHVPSSRRPEPPEVAYVIPTFAWSETRERLELGRRGQLAGPLVRTVTARIRTSGLRVYLRRPWFSSGDGELLGVVLRRQPWLSWELDLGAGLEVGDLVRREADEVAQRVLDRGLVTGRGGARLSATARLLRGLGVPTDDTLPLAERTQALVTGLSGLGLELGTLFPALQRPAPDVILTAWGADPATLSQGPSGGPYVHQLSRRVAVANAVPVEEPLSEVTVVGHQPEYDAERGLWFCDVDLPAGAAYSPFVRLALCRYQRWSVPGLEISPVVRADFVQLPPTRVLRVRSGTPKQVTLTGSVGSRSATSLSGRRVQARVEARPVGGTDLDWRPLGETVALPGSLTGGLAEATWSGSITPLAAPEGHERRLLVEEFETHPTDADPDDPWGEVSSLLLLGSFLHSRARLVYADSVPL